jgi:hypothetical protein
LKVHIHFSNQDASYTVTEVTVSQYGFRMNSDAIAEDASYTAAKTVTGLCHHTHFNGTAQDISHTAAKTYK